MIIPKVAKSCDSKRSDKRPTKGEIKAMITGEEIKIKPVCCGSNHLK